MGNSKRDFSPKIDRTVWLYIVSFVGFSFSLLAFWPGFMEIDSFMQYAQAKGLLSLNDWHPISMAILWRILLYIHDGPEVMLILQISLYWGGFLYLALGLYRDTANFPLALGAIIIAFSPFSINFPGVIWKDVELAISFFWACILLCFKPSRSKLILSLVFIYYGISVRHNGLFAALPVAVLWSDRFSRFAGINHKFRLPILTFTVFLFYELLGLTLSQFINFEKTSPLNAQFLNEITYIQCQSPREDLAFPITYYGEAWQTSEPKYRKKRICDRVIALASTTDTNSIFDEGYLKNPSYRDPDIKRLWLQSVMGSPLRYLQYRAIVYRTFLRPFSYAEPSYYLYDTIEGQDIVPNYFRPSMKVINPLGTTQFLIDYVNLSAQYLSILFRPFFWLLLLIFIAGFFLYKKDRFTFFVSLSGLLYLLMYFFFLPSPDFRYAYYSIFATITAIFGILKTYVN
ncbi:MAG: hypothetical protein N5P05_000971 [Chroococcopsis gigantea SAG 12.99]|jgi:hypothetical protein|nr:hypothetical protein [Chlorogloea purpurea SAG 13.99]MDV2999365.1 hypothetical protein [Chroococcopsis gigantea SAG 12.99]